MHIHSHAVKLTMLSSKWLQNLGTISEVHLIRKCSKQKEQTNFSSSLFHVHRTLHHVIRLRGGSRKIYKGSGEEYLEASILLEVLTQNCAKCEKIIFSVVSKGSHDNFRVLFAALLS